jgi:hypothetical protein
MVAFSNAAKEARAQSLVVLQDICEEFKIPRYEARLRLRRAGITTNNGCTRGSATPQNCNACGRYSWVIGQATG